MTASAGEHDRFFEELYERTTAPFVTPALTAAEVAAFLGLTKLSAGARLLDLGCGSGRHLGVLRAFGLEAVGLEKAASLSRKAAQRGPAVRGDMLALPFRSGSFDAVACFYSSIFFFGARDLDAVREVARVLRPGGVFTLQTANPIHLRKLGPQTTRHTLPNGDVVEEHASFDPEEGVEHATRRLVTADGATHEGRFSVRHYAPGELEVMGLRSGLRLERTVGSLTLEPFTRESRELIVLLRRKA